MVMMTKEGSAPRVRVLVPGRGHVSYIVKCIITLRIFFSTPRRDSDKVSVW